MKYDFTPVEPAIMPDNLCGGLISRVEAIKLFRSATGESLANCVTWVKRNLPAKLPPTITRSMVRDHYDVCDVGRMIKAYYEAKDLYQ